MTFNFDGFNGSSDNAFDTALRTRYLAFSVACSLLLCTQLHCSRIFEISTLYGFTPPSLATRRKVCSCIRGEHDAMTTPSSLHSLIVFLISEAPTSEHIYLYSFATTTPLR